jgi:hypothetical protein
MDVEKSGREREPGRERGRERDREGCSTFYHGHRILSHRNERSAMYTRSRWVSSMS